MSVLAKLKERTEICKVCFKNFTSNSYRTIGLKRASVCEQCYKNFHPVFKRFRIEKIQCLALYDYDDFIKEKLFVLKGCYDIELAVVFLSSFLPFLRLKFTGFYIVPIPSFIDDDLKRGFNHVEEIFKGLKFPVLKVLKKTSPIKQSDQKIEDRNLVIKRLKIYDGNQIKGKKILLVDDVFTTGSTIKSCIALLSEFNPKRIEVLVMAKVIKKQGISSI